MSEVPRGSLPRVGPGPSLASVWEGEPVTPADLTASRARLRAAVRERERPDGVTDDDLDRLLLVFEELGSNGLRHGVPPVRVSVSETGTGWLVEVCDGAVDSPPTPAVGRDAALGGLGLHLVARLSAANGWEIRGDHKYVWARIEISVA